MATFNGIEELYIDCGFNLVILPHSKNFVEVKEFPKDKGIKVSQDGNELTITTPKQNGGVNVINFGGSNSVISIGSGNSSVFINGVNVSSQFKAEPAIEITVLVPVGLDLFGSCSGSISAGDANFKKISLSMIGDGDLKVSARSAKLRISGSTDTFYRSLGGDLKYSVLGSGDLKAGGEFSDVDISVSGSGDCATAGSVSGDYEASVSGSGSVSHSGPIKGRSSKSVSGSGRIRLN